MTGSVPTRPRANEPILSLPLKAKPLRVALWGLTVLSAAAALFVEPALAGAVARGAISLHWRFIPIVVYGVFFLAYAVDRWFLVQRRAYPTGKAFFQVVFGLVFGLVLLPSTLRDYTLPNASGTERLLAHPDPDVRGVAVEALGYRGSSPGHVRILVRLLDDREDSVRETALRVLRGWSGRPAADVAGIKVWASALSTTSTVSAGEEVH